MMMRFLILALAALAAASSDAFHVQMGFSGYANQIAKAIDAGTNVSPDSPWGFATIELGSTPERVGREYNFENGRFGEYFYIAKHETTTGSGWIGPCLMWNTPSDPLLLTVYGDVKVTIGECVQIPTFGWSYLPYVDQRFQHGILTVRGDPYSVVMNDTDKDRTVNGVLIRAGDAASLPFPIHLKTAEIPNVKFYDLDSGDEIAPYDYASYGQSGQYYNHGGYYTLSWTGNIRISDGTTVTTNAPVEKLVFGDMVAANEDKVLFATNGMPMRSAIFNVTTNFQLMTWWDFSTSDWGSSPKAKINDEVVCSSHSTSHIISYTVNGNNIKVNEMTGKGYVYFTMSQEPQSGYSGGNCTMRCWDKGAGGGTAGYSAATADHKAEVSAGTGVARFRVTVDIYAGTWKVEAL